MGTEYVLSSIREKFWIIKGKAAVRSIVSNCIPCKRQNSTPSPQIMADLPSERLLSDKPPFTSVGIDYFGPFYIKRARSQVKRYGCIFSCLSTRAVHIEVAESLDTDSFVNALVRFMALRGRPEVIYSDNGTNLRAGEKELRESLQELNQAKIDTFLIPKEITWKFNPPAASHMGGVWERIIRSVRKILKSLLGQQIVTDEVLRTTLSEVQAILNTRPLTALSEDPKDNEPLTPNHLLLLKGNPSLAPGIFDKNDCYSKRRWRQVQYLAGIFWKRWTREYLPLLQVRQKWLSPKRNISVDDLILVMDENSPRGNWPLGRVVEVHKGRDGYVRSAKIWSKSTFLTRPISKSCILEQSS